jgi:hypothetical protein
MFQQTHFNARHTQLMAVVGFKVVGLLEGRKKQTRMDGTEKAKSIYHHQHYH